MQTRIKMRGARTKGSWVRSGSAASAVATTKLSSCRTSPRRLKTTARSRSHSRRHSRRCLQRLRPAAGTRNWSVRATFRPPSHPSFLLSSVSRTKLPRHSGQVTSALYYLQCWSQCPKPSQLWPGIHLHNKLQLEWATFSFVGSGQGTVDNGQWAVWTDTEDVSTVQVYYFISILLPSAIVAFSSCLFMWMTVRVRKSECVSMWVCVRVCT